MNRAAATGTTYPGTAQQTGFTPAATYAQRTGYELAGQNPTYQAATQGTYASKYKAYVNSFRSASAK